MSSCVAVVNQPIRIGIDQGYLPFQTTHNWHEEHGRSTEAKQKEKTATTGRSDLNPPNKHAGLVPVRLGKLNKTVINV